MANQTQSEPYYDQISHAATPGTRYVTSTAAVTGEFAGLYVVTDSKFSSITSTVTGFSGLANATAGSASSIGAGTYLAGDLQGFTLHSGIVLAIRD
jgi:hypothetical protein